VNVDIESNLVFLNVGLKSVFVPFLIAGGKESVPHIL